LMFQSLALTFDNSPICRFVNHPFAIPDRQYSFSWNSQAD
jgi:hypothetical protein